MTSGMAEVIAAHGYFLGEGDGCRCRNWSGRDDEPSHYAHVAEELAKAGYGDVREAKREAWDDAYVLGVEDHKTSLDYTSDDFGIPGGFPWHPARANPYQEAPHGVD